MLRISAGKKYINSLLRPRTRDVTKQCHWNIAVVYCSVRN
jgi:hypothetical protein